MINGTAEQFQKFANDYNKMMLESWSNWTKQTIGSDSFAVASGAFVDWSLSTQKMMTELSGQVMESLDIPRRSDLARLSAQVQAVESRLLGQEESQDDIRDMLVQLMKKIDEIPAAQAPAEAPAEEAKAAPAEESKAKKSSTKKSRKGSSKK